MELYFFWQTNCKDSQAARVLIERVAAEQTLKLRVVDARSPEAGRLILGLEILEIPTLVLIKDKRKVAALSGSELQSATKLTKTILKHRT